MSRVGAVREPLCVIDLSALHKGKSFADLPDAYSIFLVPGDPFDKENPKPIRVFTRKDEDGRPLGDGTTIIYMNVLYQDLNTELGRMCHDFCCSDPEQMLIPELKDIVTRIKTTPEGEKCMSSIIAELESKAEKRGAKKGWEQGRKEGRKEGREEGRKEGREEGRREMIRDNVVRMLGLGKTLEDIAQSLALPPDEVRLMAERLRGA